MQLTISDTEIFDPGILDRTNPRSMINICPPKLAEFVARIPREAFLMTEGKLAKRAKPDFTAKCLRIQFWQEYVRAQDKNQKMVLSNIIKGVTHKDYILHLAKTSPYQFAWICVPPRSYDVTQKQILEEALEKMREITQTSLYDTRIVETEKDGVKKRTISKKLNTGAMAEVRKTAEMLQARIMGSLTHNINHKISADTGPEPAKPVGPGLVALSALDEINKSLDSLETMVVEHPPVDSPGPTANEVLGERYGLDRTKPEGTLAHNVHKEAFEAALAEEPDEDS